MNTIVKLSTTIIVTTVLDKTFIPLRCEIELGIGHFEDIKPYHQAMSMERIRFILNTLFDEAIFISRDNKILPQLKAISDSDIAECWDDPWDQFIAIMAYHKASACLEDKGYIEYVSLKGNCIPDLKYHFTAELLDIEDAEETEEDLEYIATLRKVQPTIEKLWYHRSDLTLNEDITDEPRDTWESVGMGWDQRAPKDDGPVKPITNNVRKFVPRVVK